LDLEVWKTESIRRGLKGIEGDGDEITFIGCWREENRNPRKAEGNYRKGIVKLSTR
jgi:hypothetical protein